MRPRVARIRDQSAYFPPFDGQISRVRGRARRRCWSGSVNLWSGEAHADGANARDRETGADRGAGAQLRAAGDQAVRDARPEN